MRRSVLPGFKLTLGYTLTYLTLIVLIPLLTLPLRAASVPWEQLKATITDPRVIASYQLSIGASFVAACVNAVFGLVVAWVLVRYSFPGRRIVDSLVDLPFALPTAVAGITLTTLCAPNGWIGQLAEPYGVKLAFSRVGVTRFDGHPRVHTEVTAPTYGARGVDLNDGLGRQLGIRCEPDRRAARATPIAGGP